MLSTKPAVANLAVKDLAVARHFYVGDGMRVAWFKDPDGNILNLVD